MSDDNWAMKFFHTLPVEMQKLAWSAKKDEKDYLKPFDATKTRFRWETPKDSKEPPKAK